MATDEIPLPFVLTDGDRRNPLWIKLKDHFEQELANKRGKNDGELDPIQTATIRGHIAFLKAFLALGTEPPLQGG